MMNLTSSQLRRAADIKDKIESLQKELDRMLGSVGGAATAQKRRKMIAAGRANIRAAVKARWAKAKGKKASGKSKRKMSAANKAKLSARMKSFWKAKKATQKK